MKTLFIVAIFTTLLFSSCSQFGETQCDTIAALSAETARFVCNAIANAQATVAAGNMSEQDKLFLSREMTVVEKYLQNQAENSAALEMFYNLNGDLAKAKTEQERGALVNELYASARQITNKIK